MAESPAHRFGQVIGELLEAVIRPQLELLAQPDLRGSPPSSGKVHPTTQLKEPTFPEDLLVNPLNSR